MHAAGWDPVDPDCVAALAVIADDGDGADRYRRILSARCDGWWEEGSDVRLLLALVAIVATTRAIGRGIVQAARA